MKNAKKQAYKQRSRLKLLMECKHPVHRHFTGVASAVIPFVEDEVVANLVIEPIECNFEGEPRHEDLFGDGNIAFCEQEEHEHGMALQEQFGFHGSFEFQESPEYRLFLPHNFIIGSNMSLLAGVEVYTAVLTTAACGRLNSVCFFSIFANWFAWFSVKSLHVLSLKYLGCTTRAVPMGVGKGKGKGKGKKGRFEGKGTSRRSTPFVKSVYFAQFGFSPEEVRIPKALRHEHIRPKDIRKMLTPFPRKWRSLCSHETTKQIFCEIDNDVGTVPSPQHSASSEQISEEWLMARNLGMLRNTRDVGNKDTFGPLSQTPSFQGSDGTTLSKLRCSL
jgi:hypothetical protein